MIDKKELRIGNWATVFGHHVKIVGLHFAYAKIFDGADQHYEVLQPIPLTPEILEKCGFKTIDGLFFRLVFQYADSDYPCELAYGTDKEYVQVVRNFTSAADAPFKFLHQLQNLYFALTGEELKIDKL